MCVLVELSLAQAINHVVPLHQKKKDVARVVVSKAAALTIPAAFAVCHNQHYVYQKISIFPTQHDAAHVRLSAARQVQLDAAIQLVHGKEDHQLIPPHLTTF